LLTNERKGEASIVAAVLLVALSAVGGAMVFLWNAGIFGNTTSIVFPSTESLRLIGYDARDTADLTGITGPAIDNTSNRKLQAGEYIVLILRNTGVEDMMLTKAIVMNKEHVWDSDVEGPTDSPQTDTFEMYSGTNGNPSASKATAVIAPGEDARMVIKLHTGLPSDIDVGRNLQVRVKSGVGSIFNFPIVMGEMSGG
jgi:hypothetical protein